MTTQVVALAVKGRTSGRCTPGQHGPVLLSGELRVTFRVQRYAVLSESRMREICLSGSMRIAPCKRMRYSSLRWLPW